MAIILAIYDTFTVVVASQALAIGVPTLCVHAYPVCFQTYLMTLAKARPAQMIFITTSNSITCGIKYACSVQLYSKPT